MTYPGSVAKLNIGRGGLFYSRVRDDHFISEPTPALVWFVGRGPPPLACSNHSNKKGPGEDPLHFFIFDLGEPVTPAAAFSGVKPGMRHGVLPALHGMGCEPVQPERRPWLAGIERAGGRKDGTW